MVGYSGLCFAAVAASPTIGFDVEGHRGARAMYPENTLKAFEYAVGAGASTLEMDMQVTQDNVIVISHEPVVSAKLCQGGNERAIRGLTLKEVQSFDCGTVANPQFPHQQRVSQKIPTLDQVFAMVVGLQTPESQRVQFNIETKIAPGHPELSPSPEEFVRLFLDVVEKHKMLDRCILESFDHRTLRIAKRLRPGLRIAALIDENFINLPLIAKDLKADIISPAFDWITPESVTQLHRIGVRVIPWTVNEPSDWKKMWEMHVDGMISDDPAALRTFVQNHSRGQEHH
jgi:glycerophosphoryl diester phosphodiesterase